MLSAVKTPGQAAFMQFPKLSTLDPSARRRHCELLLASSMSIPNIHARIKTTQENTRF